MTREEYIKLRVGNKTLDILFRYYLERGGINMHILEFKTRLEKYVDYIFHQSLRQGQPKVPQGIYQEILDKVIEYYDAKFNIIILTVEKEVKVKKIVTTIIL